MAAPDRPFSEVLKSIFGNVEDMIRAEMKLATRQAREEIAEAARGAAWFAVAISSGVLALAFVLVAVFCALLPFMPNWAAALIIAGALALVSIVTVAIGAAQRKHTSTSETSKTKPLYQEEISWAKQQAK